MKLLALLRLFLCRFLCFLSHRSIPPFRLGYAEVRRDTASASAAWHSASPVPAVFALCGALTVLHSRVRESSAQLVKRVGQSVRTAPVSGLALLGLLLRRLLCLLRHCSLLMGGDSA